MSPRARSRRRYRRQSLTCRRGPRGAAFTPGPLVVEQYVSDQSGAELCAVPVAGRSCRPCCISLLHFFRRAMRSALSSGRATCGNGWRRPGTAMVIALVGKLATVFRHIPRHDGCRARQSFHRIFRDTVPRRLCAGRRPAPCLLIIALSVVGRAAAASDQETCPSVSALTGVICSPGVRLRRSRAFPFPGHERLLPAPGGQFYRCAGTSKSCSTRAARGRAGKGFRRAFS